MKNTYTTPADFWQVRDFGAKISAVFEFIGAHWRRLGKCLVYFMLPAALLLGIGLGLLTNSVWNRMGTSFQRARLHTVNGSGYQLGSAFSYLGVGLTFVGILLAMLLLLATVYGYLRARLRLPAAEPVTPAAVWVEIRSQLGRMALAFLLFLGVGVGLVFGLVLLVGLFFPLVLVGYIGLFYVGIALQLYLPVLWMEDVSVAEAVGRCFQLIKGKWWSTFGLVLVASLIQGAMGIVFALPQYAVLVGKMLQLPGLGSDVLGLVTQTIYAVGLLFTYCIPLLAIAFQYFNLVERHEGYGLSLLVNELGQPQAAPTAYSDHYRPEEEQY